MELSGLHLLLTYQCTFECDHCFVWGSPWQSGTMTFSIISGILDQAQNLGTVGSIYFEGGEPFLYYSTLLRGLREAAGRGFKVGVVTNGYWATDEDDAVECLRPLVDLISDLSVSSDLFHYSEVFSRQAARVRQAAERLGISASFLTAAQTGPENEPGHEDAFEVMYRGRAVDKLAPQAPHHPWTGLTECPHEDLKDPGRLHVDPLGNLHLCQGLVIGNLFEKPLAEIWAEYDPETHPLAGPILKGGPAELVRKYSLPHQESYADACHLCYEARRLLRRQFPDHLRPDQVYGEY